MKVCRDCGEEKPFSEFYKTKTGGKPGPRGGDGYRSRCIPCFKAHVKATKDLERQRRVSREYQRARRARSPKASWEANLKKYRLTPEEYDEMLRKQGGVCAMCKQPPQGKRLSVDHDHSCCSHSQYKKPLCGNCNRGLLCQPCNILLGYVETRQHLVSEAIDYLERTAK